MWIPLPEATALPRDDKVANAGSDEQEENKNDAQITEIRFNIHSTAMAFGIGGSFNVIVAPSKLLLMIPSIRFSDSRITIRICSMFVSAALSAFCSPAGSEVSNPNIFILFPLSVEHRA